MFKRRLTFVAFLALTAISLMAQQGNVPAYHAGPAPRGAKLPPILPPERLWGDAFQHAYQKHAYELAAKIPAVLYQQPCYCYCDRMGHGSLQSCFEDTHGAMCDICLKELYYAYRSTKGGRTPRQIREGIIAGQWKQVDPESAAKLD